MATNILVEKIASSVGRVPERAAVLRLRQHGTDELETRAKRLLATIGEVFSLPVGRADWKMGNEHTFIRMPGRSWAQYHHASGAMKVVGGLEPMQALFENGARREELIKTVESTAARLNLRDWIGRDDSVKFERLWSIKAAAATREGQQVEPVLCRVVGAYRHHVEGLPVWGPASIALKLANGGQFDSLSLSIREKNGETIDTPKMFSPQQAAQNLAQQLETLMGQSKINLDEAAKVDWAHFGYLSLPRRKAQSVLAPVYVASISITTPRVSQGYVLVTSATEKNYLALSPYGHEAPAMKSRDHGALPVMRRMKTFERVGAFGQLS